MGKSNKLLHRKQQAGISKYHLNFTLMFWRTSLPLERHTELIVVDGIYILHSIWNSRATNIIIFI